MADENEKTTPKRRSSRMGPGGGPAPAEKAKDFKSAIKRLFKELNIFKIAIVISFILAILSSILSIMAPNKLADLTDEISKGLMGMMDLDAVKAIAIFLAIIYIASALFNFIQSIIMTEVANRFAKSLRTRISKKINKLPLRYFDKNSKLFISWAIS